MEGQDLVIPSAKPQISFDLFRLFRPFPLVRQDQTSLRKHKKMNHATLALQVLIMPDKFDINTLKKCKTDLKIILFRKK
jgi:hypothetical protein